MDIDLLSLLEAAAGGFFGAAVGALQAFVFTGLVVLIGVASLFGGSDPTLVTDIAFGPLLGPHVAFVGGVAAVAYAARRSQAEGKDIVGALARLGRPDVLLVGAGFGVAGHVVQQLVTQIPWFGSNTDSVAFTVIIMAILTRLAFGKTGLFARNSSGAGGLAGYAPDAQGFWVRGQEKVGSNSALGIFAGLLGAAIALAILGSGTAASDFAHVFPFGLSAVSLIFLSIGVAVPVTHHITLPAGLAAVSFMPVVDGNQTLALVIGALVGLLGAWLAELFARLWQSHGDTHVDPPAAAIWPTTTLVLGLAAAFGG